MDERTRRNWIALSLWDGIGPKSAQKIISQHGSLELFFGAWRKDAKNLRIHGRASRDVNIDHLLQQADIELKRAGNEGFTIITLGDPAYPALLASIPDAPLVIYGRGRPSLLSSPSIAIVGTRYPTPYGMEVANKLSREISRHCLSIVSGLALGIDAIAHEAALMETGDTIAVLGCGLDQNYPAANRKLRKSLENKALVITEFPWGTEPKPGHFPRRNRIISGLALGTLLVEARDRSGALITVNAALEQGREVFAIPGSINSPASRGALKLIQQGAIPVGSIEDILNHLPQFCISHAEPDGLPPLPPSPIHPEYQPVYEKLGAEPVGIDDLIVASGLPAPKVQTLLMQMELDGLVQQLPGKRFKIGS